jgi:hypothetical protein
MIQNKSGVTVIVEVNGADNQLILRNNYKFDGYFRLSQPNTYNTKKNSSSSPEIYKR